MIFRSYGVSDVGLRRTVNEDSFFRSDTYGLYLVADGMGGHAAGEIASAQAIDIIVPFVERQLEDDSMTWPFALDRTLSAYGNALVTGIRLANLHLCGLQQTHPELVGMGTTIAGLRLVDDEATIAHVGDSRVYRLREGKLTLLTSDHSWVNEQLQKRIITEDEARNHRYKNVITRALGNRPDVEVDVRVEKSQVGDVYLLCTDGLTGMVPDEEIERNLNARTDLRECGNHLVALANHAGGNDNITVVLVEVLADSESE
ncbi:MAG: Stp1/IreP family PP2C-type Ser/Thr phosphatase [Candidatus Hydrogenedentota bacterium]|uniref:Protein serine/threonine phosphatase PrpC, regulation of stationary phase n=1 Tax=Sumerlaea chitinivorans TaxID=2250252 RepID=A0A2Z4Y853_SUMC1|nr:Protein serine/threonine phosphatase PrpC, regulation of stationary phase [Candidatus Sumerlaea chitinivorans]MCX7962870.1 Stp1/IreP family PP2C-type Ser/Thr phosphatase [Candidatus Sumerlaea chitinivorans]RMH24887.1 MAG: Stp1/IreP family PP2C-type Ser/Thr phosphatase [Candidatus Hydrogenedentota bacterium]